MKEQFFISLSKPSNQSLIVSRSDLQSSLFFFPTDGQECFLLHSTVTVLKAERQVRLRTGGPRLRRLQDPTEYYHCVQVSLAR